MIENCVCALDGRQACHRCLLAYVPAEDHPLVSRAEAVRMLDELLGPDGSRFVVRDVTDATTIPLADQVDSELEARFVDGLRAWCEDPRTPGSLGAATVVDGREILDLRIDTPDHTAVTHWRVELQKNLRDQIPDVMFSRLDAAPLQVALYLDGYRYHASDEHNRIADDARKRMRLRADGTVVFQLTWDDVIAWTADRPQPWRPYLGTAQQRARQRNQQLGGRGDELDELIWASPVHTLLAFLGQPDPDRWQARSEATVYGLLDHDRARRETSTTSSAGAPRLFRAALAGDSLPAPEPGGKITIVRHADALGCRLVLAIDRRDPARPTCSGFAILDDTPAAISADPEEHRQRWRSWLRWGDTLQFLASGIADGGQLAASDLDLLDPATLAVSGGTGAYLALRASEDSPVGPAGADAEPEPATVPVDPDWRDVLDLIDPAVPALEWLARHLAELGVPAPVVGYELGSAAWQAEMAWPDLRIAVMTQLDPAISSEQRERDGAYVKAGWHARPAQDWSVNELADLIGGGPSPSGSDGGRS